MPCATRAIRRGWSEPCPATCDRRESGVDASSPRPLCLGGSGVAGCARAAPPAAAEGAAFLARNATAPGVKTTASGP